MNRIELIGRLTADIELKFTSGGMAIAKTTLAVSRRLSKEKEEQYKKENKPTADFPNVILMGRNAENASKYLSKGALVAVEGSIKTNNYENAEGQKVYKTEVYCDKLQFLDFGRKASETAAADEMNAALFEIEEVTI